jgi:hypothetical protein
VKLIYKKDVTLLSKAEEELAYNKERFPTGEYVFEAWNDAVIYYFRASDSDNYRANISDAWIKVQDGKGFSIISKALLQYAKGTSPAIFNYFKPKTNSPGTLVNYLKSLKTADATLDTASPKVKETAIWHEYKLRIAYQLPKLKPTAGKLFAHAAEKWPDYPPIYGIAYAYSDPQYGGSFEAMDKLADNAIQRSKHDIGVAMYPLLILNSWKIPGYNPTSALSRLDWSLMKKGLSDYEKHFEGTLTQFFQFAELACRKGDKETARHFFEKHMNKMKEKRKNDPFATQARAPQNRCRDWAFSEDDKQQTSAPQRTRKPGI